jgi:hypothetical protein
MALLTSAAALCCTPISPAACRASAEPSDANPELEAPGLFAPTLGRPVFVEPGAAFQIVARIPNASATVNVDLVRTGQYEQRYALECEPAAAEKLATSQPWHVTVPRAVPQQTYDLEIRCSGTQLVGRHCVAVGHVDRVLRLVHLANMNVGSIGAPHFDQRLIDEINLVAPTLIIATGDFLDATHPDPAAGWRELVDSLTRFEAPIVMACGDHDDLDLYSRHVAPSPVGLVNVGRHRCLVLLDQPLTPIHDDAEQLHWVERALTQPGFDGMTFVVAHDDFPKLLRRWQQQGTLTQMIRAGRIGLWFAGGHRDWDGGAYRELIDAATPMVYLRTHQSSTASRDGASGISHYRIVDVADDRVTFPQGASPSPEIPPSTPVGYLTTTFDGPSDGSQTRLSFSAVNNLPYRLNNLALRLWLRKLDGQTPWCQGARLEQVIDLGTAWECRVRFDLPDKGGLRAVAGSGPKPPVETVDVRFEIDATLRFRQHATPDALAFLSLTNDPPLVHLQNTGDEAVSVSPLVQLDGDPVAYRPLEADTAFATAYRLRLPPGKTVSLQLDMAAIRVAPGRRELQVYVEGSAAAVPFCHAVNVVVER